MAARAPASDRRGDQSSCHETAFLLAVCCVSIRQSEGMDARCGHRRIVHDEQCDVCQHCNYGDRLFDRGHGKCLMTWAWVGTPLRTGSGWTRDCESLALQWARFSPLPHYNWPRCEGDRATRSLFRSCAIAGRESRTTKRPCLFVVKPSKSAGLLKIAGFEHACDFGAERTADEFRDVYAAAGFRLSRLIFAGGLSIIEGVPV